MKVALITSLPGLIEGTRIAKEVESLGNDFVLIDLNAFGFEASVRGYKVTPFNEPFDVGIVRGVFKSIKPVAFTLGGLRTSGKKLFDNNLIAHMYSIDKTTDVVRLAIAKMPVPKTIYIRSFDKIPELAAQIGYPVVFKLTRSGKGASVYKFESEKELSDKIAELQTLGKDAKSFLLQEFIDYQHDLRVLAIGDQTFAMKRIPRTGDFRANFSLGGTVEPFELSETDTKLAIAAAGAIGLSVAGVDILIDKKGNRFVLEVNHTPGFVGMEEATGKNIGKIYVEHALANAK